MFTSTSNKQLSISLTKSLSLFILLFTLIVTQTVSGQTAQLPTCTKPNGTTYLPHCTSNDLSVVGAFLTANQCFCTAGTPVSATLNMKLFNKTGSFRTSFAFFAILERTSPTGTVTRQYITRCESGVPAGSESTIAFDDPIQVVCGERLKLTNVFLAWTDASDKRVCDLVFCDIAPKCGKPQDIIITPLLTANISTSVSCDNSSTGSITVAPIGGTGPYDITIKQGTTTIATYTDVTAAQTKTGVGGGTYNITVVDNASTPCTYNTTATVTTQTCCVAPPKPTVCETPAGLCGDGKVSLTITNCVVGDAYTVTQGTSPNFTYNQTKTATTSSLTFTGLTPGVDFIAYGVNSVNNTSCTGASATCTDLSGTCAAALTSATTGAKEEVQTIKLAPAFAPKVSAAPNPYNDRIRFRLESTVSGQGSLELYNTLGQRVKTIYQGYIEKGVIRHVEYSVPKAERGGLIYQFRVGDQQTTGKLMGIKQ